MVPHSLGEGLIHVSIFVRISKGPLYSTPQRRDKMLILKLDRIQRGRWKASDEDGIIA